MDIVSWFCDCCCFYCGHYFLFNFLFYFCLIFMEQPKFESIDFYQAKSREMRESILRIIADSKTASHIGSSFSPVDIMSVLFHGVMRIDPKYPEHPDRDRFIMSKGHAAAALYAVLHQRGFLSKDDLLKFYQDGS